MPEAMSVPAVAAQIIQDFGAGAFLLGPILHVAEDLDDSWHNLPVFQVFAIGAALLAIGWLARRFVLSERDS